MGVLFFFRNYKFVDKLKTGKILYLYIIVPFIIFQIATSKLGTYLLPFYPVAAIIVAVNTDIKLVQKIAALFLVILGVGFCAVPFMVDYAKPYMVFLIIFGVIYSVLALFLISRGGLLRDSFVKSFSMMLLLATLGVYSFIPFVEANVKGYRMISEDIKSYNADKNLNVLIYRTFTPSISFFYLNDVKPIAFDRHRETQFQQYDEYKDFLIETDDELKAFISNNKELILYSRNNGHLDFEKKTGYVCEEVSLRGGNKRVSHCKSP